MSSIYPGGLDSFPTNRTDATAMATTQADDHNDYADAINQIEATLGVNPQGGSATVVDRLDSITVPGAMIMRGPFPFAFDDAGLTTGVDFYTPTVGDFLWQVISFVSTPWNGTSPKWDIFTSGAPDGLFQILSFNVNRFDNDHEFPVGANMSNGGLSMLSVVPLRFDSATPLKLVVSQNATIGGADPGASQGAADLYLLTATPVAP